MQERKREPKLKPPYTVEQMRWVYAQAGYPAEVVHYIDAKWLAKSPFRWIYSWLLWFYRPLLALTPPGKALIAQRKRDAEARKREDNEWLKIEKETATCRSALKCLQVRIEILSSKATVEAGERDAQA